MVYKSCTPRDQGILWKRELLDLINNPLKGRQVYVLRVIFAPRGPNYSNVHFKMNCPICHDPLTERIVTLGCHHTHTFHYHCILAWAVTQARPTCPCCRAPIAESDL